jgi:hypothetical protein
VIEVIVPALIKKECERENSPKGFGFQVDGENAGTRKTKPRVE